jgi:hypothetical protein
MAKYPRDSFLRNVSTLGERFLDVNKLPILPQSVYEEEYTITADVSERPELLAFKLYNNVNLWWVFALRNPDELIDPIRDFKEGVTIKLPSADVVRSITG